MLKKVKRLFLIVPLLLLIVTGATLGLFTAKYSSKIYPQTFILSKDLGGLTKNQAVTLLSNNTAVPSKLLLFYNSDAPRQEFEIVLDSIEFKYDYEQSVDNAFQKGRDGRILDNFKSIIKSFRAPSRYPLKFSFNEQLLNDQLSVIAGQVSVEPVAPSVSLGSPGIIINKGQAGEKINIDEVKEKITNNLKNANFSEINITKIAVDPTISDSEAEELLNRAQNLLKKSLILKYDTEEIEYTAADLLGLLNPYGGYDKENLDKAVQEIAKKVDREPQNPTFIFSEGKVNEFNPAKDGLTVKEEELEVQIVDSLTKLESEDSKTVEIEIPTDKKASEYKTGDVNNMGIVELIGKGVSHFRGSISSRIYNINLAASRLNGILIKPGETLSFNDALGDVSKLTGYKEAYIIKDNQTILGDGGGVCQVSTTLFRAALAAGLPIVERRAHAYRVGYYEQDAPPGLDATVYGPTTDLKIKNDTPGHVLIQTRVDTKAVTLTFELYGTKDGRVATTSKPVISDSTSPPDDLYIDDPTLPTGQIKQIEYKAWGAKVNFNYKVSRDGEIIYQKTFYSNFRPWGAVYLRGTGPVN